MQEAFKAGIVLYKSKSNQGFQWEDINLLDILDSNQKFVVPHEIDIKHQKSSVSAAAAVWKISS